MSKLSTRDRAIFVCQNKLAPSKRNSPYVVNDRAPFKVAPEYTVLQALRILWIAIKAVFFG